jgi:hypothetical protein
MKPDPNTVQRTQVTRSFIKPGVSPGERHNRLRQHGTFFSFSGKFGSPSQIFRKKQCSIPPCRRRIGPFLQADAWLGTDRVTRVKEHKLRGEHSNRTFDQVKASFACGSMVVVVFVVQTPTA